jgi:hypothetical protein
VEDRKISFSMAILCKGQANTYIDGELGKDEDKLSMIAAS